MSMMSRFSRTGSVTRLQRGTGIRLHSCGEASGMHVVIEPMLVGIVWAGQEPRRIRSVRYYKRIA